MIFFPYKLIHRQAGTPYFTTIIGAACFFLFMLQQLSDSRYERELGNYCRNEVTADTNDIFSKYSLHPNCRTFFYLIDRNDNIESYIEYAQLDIELTENEKAVLEKELVRFNAIVTESLSEEWALNPEKEHWVNYITSSFIHGDWSHFIFNMIFFFAFASAVEQKLGNVLYVGFVTLCCFTTGYGYTHEVLGIEATAPTLGLSGVIMGLMAFVCVVFPNKKMFVFYWFFILFGKLKLPVVFVALFYVAMDIYGLQYLQEETNTDYTAHIVGTATGFVVALLFLPIHFAQRKLAMKNEGSADNNKTL